MTVHPYAPVCGGAPAVEQAGGGEDEGPRADRSHPRAAPVRAPQRVQQHGRGFHDIARSRHDDGVRAGQYAEPASAITFKPLLAVSGTPRPLRADEDAIPVRSHPRQTEHFQRQAEFEGADAVIGHHRNDARAALLAGFGAT